MKPVAWRNKREPSLVRSAPPHPDYVHLWEPLVLELQCLQAERQRILSLSLPQFVIEIKTWGLK